MSLLKVARISLTAPASTWVSPDAGTVLTTTGGRLLTETPVSAALRRASAAPTAGRTDGAAATCTCSGRSAAMARWTYSPTLPAATHVPSNTSEAIFKRVNHMVRNTPSVNAVIETGTIPSALVANA